MASSNQGKIDRLEKVILDLADNFKSIEDRQQDMIRNHIETSAATIIAALRKQLDEIEKSLLIIADAIKACDCNKEILSLFEKHLGKLPEGLPVSPTEVPKTIPALGPTGTARDTRAPTGYVPTTISSFTYIPK
jgi:hypothetical protein